MTETVLSELQNPAFQMLLATILVAGLVRGFSGFGTGMIIAPVGSFLFSPQLTLVIILMIDIWPILPLVPDASRKANWRELFPLLIGLACGVPFGIAFLKFGDTVTLRWFICIVIFVAVTILWSGWRYTGPRTSPISAGIGTICGFFGGSAAMTGPPAIIYWMASTTTAQVVRANMMMMLFIAEFFNAAGLYEANIITWDGITKGLIACPVYMAGLLLGTAFFGKASEATYRRVAFILILGAAIVSLPILDNVLRN